MSGINIIWGIFSFFFALVLFDCLLVCLHYPGGHIFGIEPACPFESSCDSLLLLRGVCEKGVDSFGHHAR